MTNLFLLGEKATQGLLIGGITLEFRKRYTSSFDG